MKLRTVTLILAGLVFFIPFSAQAQNRKAAVVEPAAGAPGITLQHPWTGKKVLFIGDSISDSRDSNPGKHYYDHLSDWLGLTAYVPAISGLEMSHVAESAAPLPGTVNGN